MRTKLFGAFIAALAVAAFAVPAAAMASPSTLRMETGNEVVKEGETIKAHSTSLVFTASTGLQIKCARSQINAEVTENPGLKLAIIGGVFNGAGGTPPCATNSPGVEAEVLNVAGNLNFTTSGGTVTGSGTATFTFRITVRGVGMSTCDYEGSITTSSASGSGSVSITGGASTLLATREAGLGACAPTGTVSDPNPLTLSRRNGTAVAID
jgi:hypothetical protein